MTGRYKVIIVGKHTDGIFQAQYDLCRDAYAAAKRVAISMDTGAAVIDQIHNTLIAYTMRTLSSRRTCIPQDSVVLVEWTMGELCVDGMPGADAK
jgi:hypothetical protein